MDPWSWIQTQLDLYLQTHAIPASVDQSPDHKQLLSQWSAELRSLSSTEALGLTRIRCMVVDEAEAGLTVGYYLKDGQLHTTKYGYPIPADAEFLESVLLKRTLLVCSRVIGEPDLAIKTEIMLVPHEKAHFSLGSIVDVFGAWRDDEFHMLATVQESDVPVTDREALLRGLQDFVGAKAALWVLSALISTISERSMLAGKLIVNLTNIRQPQQLASYLSAVTRTVYVPLTLEVLNSRPFYPKKNYERERLEGNLMQLPSHTLLILDETTLEPGNLNDQGLRNVHSLQRLLTFQTVSYDYTYYSHEIAVDYRVIVLSEGKSMFKCDVNVSVEDPVSSSSADLEAARDFLKTVGPFAKLDEGLQETAEKHFCGKRTTSTYTPEEFSRLLSVAGYLATSLRKPTVDIEDWGTAVGMEQNLS